MKQVSPEKMSLAWFKLAEFVIRGEKERALSIYRLLAHSIQNAALVAQLEGDIFLAFNDERAFDSYRRAGWLYQQSGDDVQAIFTYECLCDLADRADDVLMILIGLYQKRKDEKKILVTTRRILSSLINQERFSDAHDLLLTVPLTSELAAELHEKFVLALLGSNTGKNEQKHIQSHIAAALDGYFLDTDQQRSRERVAHLLATVAALDDVAHAYACGFLKTVRTDYTKERVL